MSRFTFDSSDISSLLYASSSLLMLRDISANENAARANKKTIRPEDVIEAAKELEFDAFVPQLQSALQSEYPSFLIPHSRFFRDILLY